MSAFTQWLRRPLERRTPREVEADARAEFEFHLELLRAEMKAAGASESEIQAKALDRFGDVAAYVRRCCAITLWERHMIQRLTLLAVLVMAIGMVVLFISSQRSQARTADAIHQLSATLATRLGEPDERRAGSNVEPNGTVYIVGKVSRPGAYVMTEGLSVRRLAAAAGVDMQKVERVRISRSGPTGTPAVVQQLSGPDLALDGPDVTLMKDDIISID